jgi:hypothetical protein
MRVPAVEWTDRLVAMTREISEIHRVCDGGVPDLEIQSIIPGQYVTHILSHLAGTPPSRMASKANLSCVETCDLVDKSITAMAVEILIRSKWR